jgi:hypothetical protein
MIEMRIEKIIADPVPLIYSKWLCDGLKKEKGDICSLFSF